MVIGVMNLLSLIYQMLHGGSNLNKRKMYVFSVVFFLGLVMLAFGLYRYNLYGELNSTRKIILACQINELSLIYSDYFEKNGEYKSLTDSLFEKIDLMPVFLGCGSENINLGRILVDPWGGRLIIEQVSEGTLHIYSTNYLESGIEIYNGEIKRLK